MSELLKALADHLRTQPGARVRVVTSDAARDEDVAMLAGSEPSRQDHDLEGRKIDAVPVGGPSLGAFRAFLDGMQRPRGPIYIDSPVPITYGYVAAAIRTRGEDRRMCTLSGAWEYREALYLSRSVCDYYDDSRAVVAGLTGAGLRVEDTDRGAVAIEHPLALAQAARDAISTARGAIEESLIARWVAESHGDGWLLVDGSLPDRYAASYMVGVTKSHGTQYFPWEDQQKLLALEVGERSGVFIPIIKGRKRPVYSWYLRLHPNDGRDVYFGLVRVEVARNPEMLDMADDVSRWLLAERSPLSLPDSRWDKMIYPIRDCEQYLKSRAPSHAMLDAMLLRLTSASRMTGSRGTGRLRKWT